MIHREKRSTRGWKLVEFARHLPSGENPEIIERFVYERQHKGKTERVVGYRQEGTERIIFNEDFS